MECSLEVWESGEMAACAESAPDTMDVVRKAPSGIVDPSHVFVGFAQVRVPAPLDLSHRRLVFTADGFLESSTPRMQVPKSLWMSSNASSKRSPGIRSCCT